MNLGGEEGANLFSRTDLAGDERGLAVPVFGRV